MTYVAKTSIEKQKGKRSFCTPKRGCKDNIKVDITEIGCGGGFKLNGWNMAWAITSAGSLRGEQFLE